MTKSRDIAAGATRVEYTFTATSGQTSFSIDDNTNSLSYTVGKLDVFLNGTRLSSADFTATTGNTIVLASGADTDDIINAIAYGIFSVADRLETRKEFDYTATSGQTTFTGTDNDGETLSYTVGKIDVYLNGSHLNQTDDYVATNGTSVVLQSGATTGDILHIVAHGAATLVGNLVAGESLDVDGKELILDNDGDTSITADTDDQIDIKIAGADDFQFTANNFNVLSGSTLTVDSGANIINSGTATGFGGIEWQSIVTGSGGSSTAVAGKGYFINTTSGTHTLNLPSSPSLGDTVRVVDYAGTFDTNNLTVGRNGSNINGAASDLTVATERAAFGIVYTDSTQGWVLLEV